MSNSVSSFTTDSYSSSFSGFSYFYLYAYDAAHVAYISFDNTNSATQLRIYKRDLSSQTYSYDLTKDQITYLLSLDCPDAFIAYALTLCPCSPETSEHIPYTDKAEVNGGILARHALLSETVTPRSYSKSDYLRYESYPVNGCNQPLSLE